MAKIKHSKPASNKPPRKFPPASSALKAAPTASNGDLTPAQQLAALPPPACPYCKQPTKEIAKSAFFVTFVCPQGCPYSEKRPRQDIRKRIVRAEAAQADYSAR